VGQGSITITHAGEHGPRLLLVEPYLTDSHLALAQGLMDHVPARWSLVSLPGRFFRWRLRGAASLLAWEAAELLAQPWDGMLCSSMLNLAELRGLVPSLATTPCLAYFHENQLDYPAPGQADERQKRRDLFLAFTNLTTAQCAELVLFNSSFHRGQFMSAARRLLQRLPDAQPRGLVSRIKLRSRVLPVPLAVPDPALLERRERFGPLRIVWNHRWEHDKGPEDFFAALARLAQQGADFQVAVLGRRFARWPRVFDRAAQDLGERLVQLGWVEDRAQYWEWLAWGDVVVSTAVQEYQGLAVAEAVWAGCRPLVPNAVVYPELYPGHCRYRAGGLVEALADLAADPRAAREENWRELVQGLTWQALGDAWRQAIEEVSGV